LTCSRFGFTHSSQIAIGNWFSKNRLHIGVVVQGDPLNTENEDNRFRLRIPFNIADSKEIIISEFQRGNKATIISSSDFDGNGYWLLRNIEFPCCNELKPQSFHFSQLISRAKSIANYS
jgi:hypothetical protein